ncbi:MAG: hypothetical protein H0T80_10480 [Betaproteobacteria bacterium]|nr:hypothetical protein [Betaproteobacteria bacterium]
MPAENQLTLDVTVFARGEIRHTPAGITAIDCTLRHESVQVEAGGERRDVSSSLSRSGRWRNDWPKCRWEARFAAKDFWRDAIAPV